MFSDQLNDDRRRRGAAATTYYYYYHEGHKNMRHALFVGASFLASLLIATSTRAGVMIDDFDVGQIATKGTPFDAFFPSPSTVPLPGGPFATRTLEVVDNGAPGSPYGVALTVFGGQFASSVMAGGPNVPYLITSVISWKGSGVDLKPTSSTDRFMMSITSDDPINSLQLVVDGVSSSIFTLPGGFSGILAIPFTAFLGSPDFDDVDELDLVITQSTGVGVLRPDLSIGSISTGTPEPATLVVWSAGALCAGIWLHTRTKKGEQLNVHED